MRLIDAEPLDCLTWQDGEHGTTFDDGVLWVLSKIDEQPTIEPQEIIRCKDCKHYIKNITCVGGHYNGCAAWSDNGNEIAVGPDDYCSYAERITE